MVPAPATPTHPMARCSSFAGKPMQLDRGNRDVDSDQLEVNRLRGFDRLQKIHPPILYKSMIEQRATLKDDMTLPTGRILEDTLVGYAKDLNHIDSAHGFILDNKLLSQFEDDGRSYVDSLIQPLPTFPADLMKIIKSLTKSASTPPTIATCRSTAGTTLNPDVLWISRVMEHMCVYSFKFLLLLT